MNKDFDDTRSVSEGSMSRWCGLCGRELVSHEGKLVFTMWKDPAGNEHKVHKSCAEKGGRCTAQPRDGTFKPYNENYEE